MSVTSVSILQTAGRITVETLEVLIDIMGSPWSAYQYCDAVGQPPFPVDGEWAPTVQDIRKKADAAQDPEQWAEIIALSAKVLTAIGNAVRHAGGPAPGAVESGLVRIVVPVLLEVTKKHSALLHTLLAAAFFADQRLQEDYPQGLFAERWYAIFGNLIVKAGWAAPAGSKQDLEPEWPTIVSDGAALATVVLAVIFKHPYFKQHPIRFWYGFDDPPIPGFEDARKLAQKAFTILIDTGLDRIAPEDFDRALKPQGPNEKPGSLAFSLVPLTGASAENHKLYLQVHGQSEIDEAIGGGFTFKLINGSTFGLMASRKGVETTGDVSFQAEIARDFPPAPKASAGDVLSFRADRLSLGARASLEDVSAWFRVEKGVLSIAGGTWLNDFVPQLRLTFDLTAEASVLDGVRFQGGAGGDVLIPVNVRVPIVVGSVQVESIHIRFFFGDDNGEMTARLEGAANLTLALLGILKVHVDGLGAQYAAGTARKGDGNVAGIARHGWEPVIPEGAGLELKVWKIQGGGAFFSPMRVTRSREEADRDRDVSRRNRFLRRPGQGRPG